jgi:hypothetical protein
MDSKFAVEYYIFQSVSYLRSFWVSFSPSSLATGIGNDDAIRFVSSKQEQLSVVVVVEGRRAKVNNENADLEGSSSGIQRSEEDDKQRFAVPFLCPIIMAASSHLKVKKMKLE